MAASVDHDTTESRESTTDLSLNQDTVHSGSSSFDVGTLTGFPTIKELENGVRTGHLPHPPEFPKEFDSHKCPTMVVVMRHGGKILRLFSCYAPQVGRSEAEKDLFYEDLQEELLERKEGEVILMGGDFNGHVGSRADGYEDIHGGHGIGMRNEEGRRLLEVCSQGSLALANTWFEKQRKVIYQSGTTYRRLTSLLLIRYGESKCRM